MKPTIEVLTWLSSPELVGEIMINTFHHNWKSRGQNSLRHKKESSIKVQGSRSEEEVRSPRWLAAWYPWRG